MNLSLRARLLLTVAGLLAVVSVVAGVAIRAELRSYLVDRVDGQLSVAGDRFDHADRTPGGPRIPDGDKGPPGLNIPGQPDGTVGATIVGTVVTAGVNRTTNGATAPVALSDAASRALLGLPVDGRPRTRNLDQLGSYRLIATRRPDGSVQVTGLPLSGVDATISRLTVVGGVIAGVLILVAIVIGGFLIRLALRPLRRVATTAVRVSELPLASGEVELSHRVPESQINLRTEVGQVGAALNRLLDHVDAALTARQASETQIRQFVADASHELRTPLASIQGYAELCRRTNADVPEDVAYALSRVESESKRMAVLVDDLLLLARLDAGRALGQEEVDLTALVVASVGDAHAAGPDHDWRLELPDEPVVVTGDPQRLHQVLANLLSNARVHTPAGTWVLASLSRTADGRSARIEIVDDGPGIPADLLPHVFERFARGDSSRSRAAGSSGLGLAIVSAVVAAHGGTLSVASQPGRTEFVVTLPLKTVAGEANTSFDPAVAAVAP